MMQRREKWYGDENTDYTRFTYLGAVAGRRVSDSKVFQPINSGAADSRLLGLLGGNSRRADNPRRPHGPWDTLPPSDDADDATMTRVYCSCSNFNLKCASGGYLKVHCTWPMLNLH